MKKRNIVLKVLLLVILLAAIGTAVFFLRGRKTKPIPVYGFADGTAGMADYYEPTGETSGMVSTDRVQPVYLSETQQGIKLQVEEGQHVKKGDVLFTYDTTLSEIALKQKELSIQQLELDLDAAKKELAVIKGYVPMKPAPEPEQQETPPMASAHPLEGHTQEELDELGYLILTGGGETSMKPLKCWLNSTTMVDQALMEALFASGNGEVLFVRFFGTEDDMVSGMPTESNGVKLIRVTDSETGECTYAYSFYSEQGSETEESQPSIEEQPLDSGYSAAEIGQMKAEKSKEIHDLEFQIKVGQSELSIMKKEADAGEVKAEFDGIVQKVSDPDQARQNKEPLLKVSGGGGFYVTGLVSELDLGLIQVGQTVSVTSWDTGASYEGTVTEIQQFPQNSEEYGADSSTLSQYPYRVFIDESADLQDGFYVSMSLQADQSQKGIYVNNAFVRTDGAVNYVYVRGEDGTLEKRQVRVGQGLWNSYTQVLEGVTEEDYLAFPYGKNVREGAATEEGTPETLYNLG